MSGCMPKMQSHLSWYVTPTVHVHTPCVYHHTYTMHIVCSVLHVSVLNLYPYMWYTHHGICSQTYIQSYVSCPYHTCAVLYQLTMHAHACIMWKCINGMHLIWEGGRPNKPINSHLFTLFWSCTVHFLKFIPHFPCFPEYFAFCAAIRPY